MSNYHNIVSKVLTDEEFAKELVENPEQTLRDAGVEPTPEILEALSSVDVEAIQKLAQTFGDDKAA